MSENQVKKQKRSLMNSLTKLEQSATNVERLAALSIELNKKFSRTYDLPPTPPRAAPEPVAEKTLDIISLFENVHSQLGDNIKILEANINAAINYID